MRRGKRGCSVVAQAIDGLSQSQERAVVALLNESTLGRAASVAEVGERTLYRWLREPVFSKA